MFGWLNAKKINFDDDKYAFAADLVRLRAKVDRRISRRQIEEWPFSKHFNDTADGMILDVVTKYHRLRSFGLKEADIWDRIESIRENFGTGNLPLACNLEQYIVYRLNIEDSGYLRLPADFLASQITLARKYAAHQKTIRDWPPENFLQRRLSALEVERSGLGEIPAMASAPAAYQHGHSRIKAEMQELKLFMLPGDELWLFSNGSEAWKNMSGIAGIALVRDDRTVEALVTARN